MRSESEAVNVEVVATDESVQGSMSLPIPIGANLWVFLRKSGLFRGLSCSGVGMCGQCAVEVCEGCESALSSASQQELEALTKLFPEGAKSRLRLACQARVLAPLRLRLRLVD